MRRLYCLLLAPLFLLLAAGCDKDDEGMPLLSEEFVLDADASTLEFRVPLDEWWVYKVYNLQGEPYIRYQSPMWDYLYLQGVGRLEVEDWIHIEHTSDNTFRIGVDHNNVGGTERGIIVQICAPGSLEGILYTFRQPPSESVYRLESITYTLEDDDVIIEVDSLAYIGLDGKYTNNGTSAYTVLFHPYEVNFDYYLFTSREKGAFSWYHYPEEEFVSVPNWVENGKILFNNPPDMAKYGGLSYQRCSKQPTEEIVCEPKATTEVYASVYYKLATCTYHLTIVNIKTGEKEKYTGKLEMKKPYSYNLMIYVKKLE